MKPDPIRDLVQRLLAAAESETGLSAEVALSIEDEFRREYASESIYVMKRLKLDNEDIEQMGQRYLANEPPDQIANSKGITRRHMYRLLRGR
jgi:hypothetical protein